MSEDAPIYVVDLEEDEGLRLRAAPGVNADVIATLLPGQVVARLDFEDRGVWWHIFADTPGDGASVGYVHGGFLRSWRDAQGAHAPAPGASENAGDTPTGDANRADPRQDGGPS